MNIPSEYNMHVIHPFGGAVFSGRLFLFSEDKDKRNNNEMKKGTHQPLTTRIEPTGKGSDRFSPAGKVGPCGFGKNHPRFAPVFFPKTLPCRKRPLYRPYSSMGLPKPRVFTI